MVLLTIVAQTNGETVFLDEPFPKVHFMRLISCSLYNSWHNLTRAGQLSFKKSGEALATIPQGHYTVETLANELATGLKSKIEFKISNPYSVLKITQLKALDGLEIQVSHVLARLIGSSTTLAKFTYTKKLNSPSIYFIHCDLNDKNQNFLNNKKSYLLATFDIKGKPYEKVNYDASPQQPLRDCSTDSHVNSITLSIRDQDGELFDFNGLPLEFQLEIN